MSAKRRGLADPRWERTPGGLYLPRRPTLPTRRFIQKMGAAEDCCGGTFGPCVACDGNYAPLTLIAVVSGAPESPLNGTFELIAAVTNLYVDCGPNDPLESKMRYYYDVSPPTDDDINQLKFDFIYSKTSYTFSQRFGWYIGSTTVDAYVRYGFPYTAPDCMAYDNSTWNNNQLTGAVTGNDYSAVSVRVYAPV